MKDLNNKSITREAQVRNREVTCGSSVDQTDELMLQVPPKGNERSDREQPDLPLVPRSADK
ncbi:MAG TPA: hypothetical protein DEA90_15300, partial [Opitutae bacterium]|nr:hypothetical protein [Opitutae bacterium]